MRIFLALLCIATASVTCATEGWTQNAQAVLSWGSSCPTVVRNMNFGSPGHYLLWLGLKNLTAADKNVGTDSWLFYGPTVPDAWRFDDAGCQTGSQVALDNLPNTPACPPMVGTNPLSITNFFYNTSTGRMEVRLAIVYDDFTPVAGTNYTLWNINFDHSFSHVGTDNNPSTCDNVQVPLCISISDPNDVDHPSLLLLTTGQNEIYHFGDPRDQFASWNMGCMPVPAQQTTWGRIKAVYH